MKQSTKTILLWLTLIVLFVAFYQVFTDPSAKREPRVICETNWNTVLLTWSVPAVLIGGLIWWMRWQQRRFRGTHEGVKLMNEGRNLQALEVFERERAAAPKEPAHVFNCGVVKLVQWRLAAAQRDLDAARPLKGAGQGQVAVMWTEHYPVLCALLGTTDEGFRVLADAPKEAMPARLKLAQGALLARRGEWQPARACLNSLEVKQLGGWFGILARTLDALCIERLTGELRHVDRVGLFGEGSPDEARQHWPELVDFIERAPAW